MKVNQEPKYGIIEGKLFNRQSGEKIPDDEPVFILRARDKLAIKTIGFYLAHVLDDTHSDAVALRLKQFRKFAREHAERMKEADTLLTDDWDNLQ